LALQFAGGLGFWPGKLREFSMPAPRGVGELCRSDIGRFGAVFSNLVIFSCGGHGTGFACGELLILLRQNK